MSRDWFEETFGGDEVARLPHLTLSYRTRLGVECIMLNDKPCAELDKLGMLPDNFTEDGCDFVEGTARLAPNHGALSDYTPEGILPLGLMINLYRADQSALEAYTNAANLRQLCHDLRFVVVKVFTLAGVACGGYTPDCDEAIADEWRSAIDYSLFAKTPLTLANVFGRYMLRDALESTIDGATSGARSMYRHSINTLTLRRRLGLSESEIGRLVVRYEDALEAHPDALIDPRPLLEPYAEQLWARYNGLPKKIEWAITDDPSRQYTVSRQPRMEDPAEWYGEGVVGPADFVLRLPEPNAAPEANAIPEQNMAARWEPPPPRTIRLMPW